MNQPLKERLVAMKEFWSKPRDGKRSRVKRAINPDGPEALARIEALRDALIQADLTIRSFPGADQSHVEFIRYALNERTKS